MVCYCFFIRFLILIYIKFKILHGAGSATRLNDKYVVNADM